VRAGERRSLDERGQRANRVDLLDVVDQRKHAAEEAPRHGHGAEVAARGQSVSSACRRTSEPARAGQRRHGESAPRSRWPRRPLKAQRELDHGRARVGVRIVVADEANILSHPGGVREGIVRAIEIVRPVEQADDREEGAVELRRSDCRIASESQRALVRSRRSFSSRGRALA